MRCQAGRLVGSLLVADRWLCQPECYGQDRWCYGVACYADAIERAC